MTDFLSLLGGEEVEGHAMSIVKMGGTTSMWAARQLLTQPEEAPHTISHVARARGTNTRLRTLSPATKSATDESVVARNAPCAAADPVDAKRSVTLISSPFPSAGPGRTGGFTVTTTRAMRVS